jgi:hypothetical protein
MAGFYNSYKRYWEPGFFTSMSLGLGVGAVATTASHPFEYFKTKVQLRAEGIGMRQKGLEMGVNFVKVFYQFMEAGYGFRHVFTGLPAALAARMSYLFTRNFIYLSIYNSTKPKKVTTDLTNREKSLIGVIAGTAGAIVSNPFEVAMVRNISDLGKTEQYRHNMGAVSDAFKRIGTEPRGYYRGLLPNIIKAAVLNGTLIGPYDYIKERMFTTFGEIWPNTVIALLGASLCGALYTLPIDNIKTRLQNQSTDPSRNRINYTGMSDCISKSLKYEGLNGLFVGMVPYYCKVLVYAMLTVYLTDIPLSAMKRRAGLEDWQITG